MNPSKYLTILFGVAVFATPDLSLAQDDAGAAMNDEASVEAEAMSADEEAALSAEEEAMLASLSSEADVSADQGPSLRFYGFSDFSAQKYVLGNDAQEFALNGNTAFYIGNLNLYMDADLTNNFTSLIEVRFLFTPTGNDDPTTPGLLDPTVNPRQAPAMDYADANRPIDFGGIELERVYIQYTAHSLLRARVGRFLTPWGIWNVDHGSPVIISASRPYVIGEGFFPEAQTGLEVFGNFGAGDATFGYHLTLSNGRGPIEQYGDFDSNKAVGGRVWMEGRWVGAVKAGFSGYYGKATDRRNQFDPTSGSVYPTAFVYEQYDEVAYAADVQYTYGRFHVQGEAAMHDRAWNDDARPNGQADNRRFGTYGLVAYELPWFNLRPYAVVQYYNTGHNDGIGGARDILVSELGLNVRVTPNVVLKGSVAQAKFFNAIPGTVAADDLIVASSQLSWAF